MEQIIAISTTRSVSCFCFISDCRNSCNCKLKKLINKQIIIFYSPSNALCSSDESVQIKQHTDKHHTDKQHTFIGMFSLSTCFNMQSEFLLMTTGLALNRSCKCANVQKPGVFYSFAINSESKLKKFSTLFLRHLPRKTR